MKSKGILITGTDTGVGKTFVACGIAAELRRRGLRVAPFKPSETGCERDERSGSLLPADALLLRSASQTQAPLETICPYRFRTPVAPAVAAELEGSIIEPQRLEGCYSALSSAHDVVLVETAGGILVPLTYDFHYGDLALLLGLPVLLVAASKLGVINQTLLTISYLEHLGIKVIGCVVNHVTATTTPATETNVKTLRKLVPYPLFVISNGSVGLHQHAEFDPLAKAILEQMGKA